MPLAILKDVFALLFSQRRTEAARGAALAALLAILLTRPLGAQYIHGAVRDSASGQPVSGAVVMVIDSAGTVLARNITNERGQYSIASAGRARRARIVRIGFEPREVDLSSIPGSAATVDVGMVRLRTMLAAVRVRAASDCPRRADGAAALGLWEQARGGLLAAVVAREANPARMSRLTFERRMDGTSDRIIRFSVGTDSSDRSRRSWTAARSARAFTAGGFARETIGSQELFAPDADVLLDDAFSNAYCFSFATAARARPNQVGLSFSPERHPRGRVDIDGTLWIDTVARALTDIEFRYVGLPYYTDDFHPGGRLSFRTMANGVVLIDRWYIRSAVATGAVEQSTPLVVSRNELSAIEIGGELARATWPDGQTWHAALGTLRVHAVTHSGQPAAGTVVVLPDTHYRGTTDANGDLEIVDLAPGPYSLDVIDSTVFQLGVGIPTRTRFTAARDVAFNTTLLVPTGEDYVVSRCSAAHQSSVGDSVFILGRVLTSDGEPVGDAKVAFSTQTASGEWTPTAARAKTGADGVFQTCRAKLTLGATVRVEVRRPGIIGLDTTMTLAAKLSVVRIPVSIYP